jgi:hypothetical protein
MKKGLLFIVIISVVFWGYYFMQKRPVKENRIKSTVKETHDSVHEANLHILETSIMIFKQKEERFPLDLQGLVDKGYLSRIPDSGQTEWDYNPQNGSIN